MMTVPEMAAVVKDAEREILRLRHINALLLMALKEAVEQENEDTDCLMGRDCEANAACPDGRCWQDGCMVMRVNEWRDAIRKAEAGR